MIRQNVFTIEMYSGKIIVYVQSLKQFTRDEVLQIIDEYAPIFPSSLLHHAWCITALNGHKE